MAPLPSVGLLPEEARGPNPSAVNRLMPLLYRELHQLARRYMAGQHRAQTLRTTDLVNEAYLKLAHLKEPEWKDRLHFLSVASCAMRSVLVDYARKRQYAKRGGNLAGC